MNPRSRISPTLAFEASSFNRSDTSPRQDVHSNGGARLKAMSGAMAVLNCGGLCRKGASVCPIERRPDEAGQTGVSTLQMERQECWDALAICGIGGAKPASQFPFLETDHPECEHPPDCQDNPQFRSPGEQSSSRDCAKHARIARVPHVRIESPPCGEHLALPGKLPRGLPACGCPARVRRARTDKSQPPAVQIPDRLRPKMGDWRQGADDGKTTRSAPPEIHAVSPAIQNAARIRLRQEGTKRMNDQPVDWNGQFKTEEKNRPPRAGNAFNSLSIPS